MQKYLLTALLALSRVFGPTPGAETKVRGHTTWPGLVRRNGGLKYPGNYCNNARQGEPHQGAQECARRRKQAGV